MTRPPELTDRRALARNRARAAASCPAMFLHEIAADEVQQRLLEVNRRFTTPALVTGWPEFWGQRFADATVVADDDMLALQPETHDLVIHALSLHWTGDPVGQLVQCRRALRPDGLFIAVLFGGETLHELRSALAEAEARVSGGLSPRVLPMGEIRDLGGLLSRAGFALPVADALNQTVSYSDLDALMRDLRAMGETNALAARQRKFARRSLLAEADRIYGKSFSHEKGRIRASFELIFLTGWAPDASQPQPLRPGSATHRLADALNARPPRNRTGD